MEEFELDRKPKPRIGGDEFPLSLFWLLPYFWLDLSNSCVKPHENTNDDNEWKCDRRTIACTNSDIDQLFGPLVKRCKTIEKYINYLFSKFLSPEKQIQVLKNW